MSEVALTFTDEEIADLEDKWIPGSGRYKFRINDVESKENKNGKPYLDLSVTCFSESNLNEFDCFGNVYLTEGAKWKYGLFLKCIGLDPKKSPFKIKDFMQREGIGVFAREGGKYLRLQKFLHGDDIQVGVDASLDSGYAVEVEYNPSIGDDDTPF